MRSVGAGSIQRRCSGPPLVSSAPRLSSYPAYPQRFEGRYIQRPSCASLQPSSSSSSSPSTASPPSAHFETVRRSAGALALASVLLFSDSLLPDNALLGSTHHAMAEVLSAPDSTTFEAPPVGEMKEPPSLKRQMSEGLGPEELTNIKVFQETTPSVVNITNLRQAPVRRGYGFSLDSQAIPAGIGSGFIWDKQGHIITNYHVIKGASQVKVTLIDQTTYTATVLGYDPDKDIAVLKLDLSPERLEQLKQVQLGTSDDLLVGQRVFALGNPFGLDHSMSTGIVSGLGRELNTGLTSIKNVIQTDAAINPGNSGGVLLDSRGRLVGINTAIADPTGKGSSSGVGFAVPISDVKGLVEQIITTGRVQRPALGITIAPPQILRQLGIEGVLVLDVPEGSPAAQAGLQPSKRDNQGRLALGDIIIGLDGKQIQSYKDLYNVMDDKKVGDMVQITVLRGVEKTTTLTVTLGERVFGKAE